MRYWTDGKIIQDVFTGLFYPDLLSVSVSNRQFFPIGEFGRTSCQEFCLDNDAQPELGQHRQNGQ